MNQPTSSPAVPANGSPAPDFELPDQRRTAVRLSAFRGERNILLLFYPFTFTPICGTELGVIRDHLAEFQNDRVQVLAVSCDTPASQRVWDAQQSFGFPILSDFWPHGATASSYGVFDDERGCAKRASFVIDRDGVVRWSIVNPIADPRDHLDYLRELGRL